MGAPARQQSGAKGLPEVQKPVLEYAPQEKSEPMSFWADGAVIGQEAVIRQSHSRHTV